MSNPSAIQDALSSLTGLPKTNIVNGKNPSGDKVGDAFSSILGSGNYVSNPTKLTSYNPLEKAGFTIDLTNVYTDPLESYTKYGVPLNPFADWNEERAQRQSTGEKWLNGLTKAGITTLGAVYENTVGVIAGLGSLAAGDSYYDNFVGRQVDEMNEWSQKHLPNYYTKAEINGSLLENLGTANFWADKFANGLGYTVGSIATMFIGTGELGLASRIGSLAAKGAKGAKILDTAGDIANLTEEAIKAGNSSQKALYTTVKGIEEAKAAGRALDAADRAVRIKTATKNLAVGVQMSLAEASVEAREAKKRFIEEQTAAWEEQNPGQTMSAEMEEAIEKSASAAGNTVFGINLPLLTATNLLMFGKTLKGSSLGEKMMFDAEKQSTTAGMKWAEKVADSKIGRAYAGAHKKFGSVVENMATEGFQEGSQFAGSEFSRDYYSDKFYDGTGDMAASFSKALSNTLGTKEGLENILIGALVGGGTGVVSKLAGAEKRLLEKKGSNTQEALKILNSGGVTNAIQNMEATSHNLALVKQMDDANKKGDYVAAETARMRIIHNVFSRLNSLGALDYAMEQFEDAASMPEEEFKKAFGYDGRLSLKEQTGKTQAELIADTKSKMETAIKRSEQVNRILSQYEPGKNLIAKIKEGLQTEETRNNKELQKNIRNMYGQMLTYHLLDIDSIDSIIENQYDKLVEIEPSLAKIPKEDLLYRLKVGEVSIDENNNIKISPNTTVSAGSKFKESIDAVFQNLVLSDDGTKMEDFMSNIKTLNDLMARRGRLTESVKNLRRNPEQMDLYVEAEMLKRAAAEKRATDDRAKQVVEGAETSEDFQEIDEDADDAIKAEAKRKRDELRALEDEKQKAFKEMSDEEIKAIDIAELEISDPQAAVALSREINDRAIANAQAFREKEEEEIPTEEDEEIFTEAEKNALNEITVDNLNKNEFVIDGRVYYVPSVDLESLIQFDENDNPVSVTLLDVQTGKPFTWKVQNTLDIANQLGENVINESGDVDYAKAAETIATTNSVNNSIEIESARALALINLLLTEAASIRSREESDRTTIEESKAAAIEQGRNAIDSATETLQKDTNLKNELKAANLVKPGVSVYDVAGISSDQLRYQIEELKQHLKALDEVIGKERQIALELGISEKQFKKIEAAELLKTRDRIMQLLNEKTKTLINRKSEESQTAGTGAKISLEVAPTDTEYGYAIDKATQEINKYEAEISEIERKIAELDKVINGEYGDQNVDDAKNKKRSAQNSIRYRRSKIREKQQLIDSINGTREIEERTKNGDVTAGVSSTPEGEESETTDIDPATRPSTEGLDGSISSEEAERIRQQKLEALEASKKMMAFTSEETPEEQKSTGVAKTVVVGDNDLDVQLSKGELEKVDGKVVVDSNGNTREDYQQMVTQTINGEEILTFPAMLTNPKIAAPGSLVEFEVRLDTDFAKDQIGDEDPNTWLANGGWKIVPIFIKQNNQVLGLLKAFDETSTKGFQGANREEISKVFLQGGTAVAKVNSKLVDTKSISNAVTEDGETFFYPFTTIKSEGNATSILYVSLDIANNLRWGVAYQGAGPDATDVASSSVKLDKLTPGQIGIVTTNPQGEPIVIIASTRDVTERTANIAIEHITKETPEAFKYSEIVGTSIVPTAEAIINPSNSEMSTSNPEIAGEVSKNLEKFIMTYSLEDGTSMFVFYSPASKSLIRIDEINLKLALLGGKPSFSFVESVMSERGLTTFKTVKVGPELRAAVEMKLGEDFKSVTLQKKMQVDKNKLMLDMEEFESPITGQVYRAGENLPHPYIQYLSSESEFTGDPRQDGKGSNAILTVDTKVNSQGSVFNDVNLRLGPLNAIGVDVTTSEELQSKSVKQTINSISPASTQPSTQPTTTDAKADIERRKKISYSLEPGSQSSYERNRFTFTYVRPFDYNELDNIRPVGQKAYIVNNYGEQKAFDNYAEGQKWLDSKYNAELAASEQPKTATTTPAIAATSERIIEAKFAQQGTSFEIEVKGEKRDFLLTWNRNNPKASLFSEKTKNGDYTTSMEYPSEEDIKKLVDKYVPASLLKLIDKWTAASKLPAGQVLDAQEKIEKEIEAEVAKLKGKPETTTPAVVTPTILEGMAKSSDSIEASEIPSEFFRTPGKNSTGNNVSSPNITGFDSLKGLFSDEVPGDILDQINSIPTDLSQFMGKIEDQGSNIEEEC